MPMASAEDHAKSSVEHFGGKWQDYIAVHDFFDVTRDIVAPYWKGTPDFRHRALRHHDVGMEIADWVFDYKIMNSDGIAIEVMDIATQHMYEDFDCIPKFDDWWHGTVMPQQLNDNGEQMAALIININAEPWMFAKARVLSV